MNEKELNNKNNRIVSYVWQVKPERVTLDSIDDQQESIKNYAKKHDSVVEAEFSDIHDFKVKNFPQLKQSIEYCVEHHLTLVIANLSNLLVYSQCSQLLSTAGLNFICLDNQAVTPQSIQAIVAYTSQVQKSHSESIKEGLSRTLSPLGNPNAAQVIGRVNKIKVENALLFALALQPIIEDYEQQGLSQRKMVNALNKAGYLAPEGGKWVLSQFQKGIGSDKKTNQLALKIEPKLVYYVSNNFTDEAIIDDLNRSGDIMPDKMDQWDLHTLKSVRKRLHTIKHVVKLYKLIESISPLLEEFDEKGLSYQQIADELNERGIEYPEE